MQGREEEVLLQEYLGSVLYSITVFAVWEIIMANFMTRRFSVKTTILLWAAAGLVYFVLPQFVLPYGTLLRAFTGFIAFALLQLLLFRDKWYKILFVILMLNAIMMIADIMAVTIGASPEILQNAMETGRQPVFSLANYAICVGVHAVLLWIFVLFLDRYKNRLAPSEWLLYLAFPISQWPAAVRLDGCEPNGFGRLPVGADSLGHGGLRRGGRGALHRDPGHGAAQCAPRAKRPAGDADCQTERALHRPHGPVSGNPADAA